MHDGAKLKDCFVPEPESFIDHGRCGHPPFELLVPQEGPAPSCCRYIRWRNCTIPSPETASPSPADDDHTSPLNRRAAPEMTKNPRITSSITGTAANPLAIYHHQQQALNFSMNTLLKRSLNFSLRLSWWSASCVLLETMRWDLHAPSMQIYRAEASMVSF